jgi:hypothetical protein
MACLRHEPVILPPAQTKLDQAIKISHHPAFGAEWAFERGNQFEDAIGSGTVDLPVSP